MSDLTLTGTWLYSGPGAVCTEVVLVPPGAQPAPLISLPGCTLFAAGTASQSLAASPAGPEFRRAARDRSPLCQNLTATPVTPVRPERPARSPRPQPTLPESDSHQ